MGFEAIRNDSEDRKGLGAGSERDDVPSLGSSLSSQGEVGGPLRVGSWGRDYVKGAQMSSPWTQQAWGVPGLSCVWGHWFGCSTVYQDQV